MKVEQARHRGTLIRLASNGFRWAVATITLAAICFALFNSPALASEEKKWFTSFADAQVEAIANDRPLLVRFSGTRWNKLCRQLNKEVFSREAFRQWADETVVVCILKRKHAKQGNPEDAATEKWAKKYGVWAYPTLLLLEPDGTYLAQMFYEPGGAKHFAKQLNTMLAECRTWNKRYKALLKTKGDSRGLKLAAYLFKKAGYADQERLLKVARYIFKYDEQDQTGHRADAAMLLGEKDEKRARAAVKHLKSISAKDKSGRYGFVLFTRSDKAFRQLMAKAQKIPKGEKVPSEVKKQAQKLYRRMKKIKPHVKRKSLLGRLYARLGVTLGCVGRWEKAERALDRAAKLGVPAPVVKGYRDFVATLK